MFCSSNFTCQGNGHPNSVVVTFKIFSVLTLKRPEESYEYYYGF